MPRADSIIAVQSNGMQVDPLLGIFKCPIGQCFSSGGQAEGRAVAVALEYPIRGLVAQEFEGGILRTQARVWFQGEDKPGPHFRS